MIVEDEGAVVDEGEVIEETDENAEGQATATQTDPNAERIAALEQELASLKSEKDTPEETPFEPEPLFSEEDYADLDDRDRKLYTALDQQYKQNQILQNKVEQLEAVNEETGRKRGIENYIADVPEFTDNPALAKAFRNEIDTVMRGNGNELLEAIKLKVLSSQKKKPAPKKNAVTGKPRSVAGSTKSPRTATGPQSLEQGLEKAKQASLAKMREMRQ